MRRHKPADKAAIRAIALIALSLLASACSLGARPAEQATPTPSSPVSVPTVASSAPAVSTPTVPDPVSVAPAADPWKELRQRPLRLPALKPGASCPTTSGREVSPHYGPALGEGPVYPVYLGTDGAMYYGDSTAEGGWHFYKVLWIASPKYKGTALIRGRQLDGPNELRFDRGSDPPAELQFPLNTGVGSAGTADGWRDLPSYTRVRAPGCYAYQVDGPAFSEVIIFKALDTPVPAPVGTATRGPTPDMAPQPTVTQATTTAELGRPGCRPPSPVSASEGGSLPEVRGAATGAELWALFFSPLPVSPKERVKIVWRITGEGDLRLDAEHTDGTRIAPGEGPVEHAGSSWDRPGDEWGSIFTFPKPGCWRLGATRGGVTGHVWLRVQGSTALVTRDDPELPPNCRPRQVAALITGFFDAVNRGDTSGVSRFFSLVDGPEGMTPSAWYTITENDPASGGRHFVAYEQHRLLDYFGERHKQHERLGLVMVDVAGPSGHGGVDISYVVTRHADDLETVIGGTVDYAEGKGAINCKTGKIFVWSMAQSTSAPESNLSIRPCPTPSGWKPGDAVIACARG